MIEEFTFIECDHPKVVIHRYEPYTSTSIHNTEAETCWCGPTVECPTCGRVIERGGVIVN